MTVESGPDELVVLLSRVAQDDRQAFRQLYQQMSGRMFGVCRKITGQTELAEEALQEAFIRIWHHAGEYHRERGTPMNWMMTIARYRTLDMVRSRRARRDVGDEALDTLADDRRDPVAESLTGENAAALKHCFGELSESQRDSIMLAYYRGFTHEELATTLATPIGTVKSWVRRGLLALKRCLEP